MIDWVTAELPCRHSPLKSGSIMKIAPDDSVDWHTPCRLSVEGSYESSIQVRSGAFDSQGRATTLFFTGNPSKFLQGHNIFGSDDLLSLMCDTYLKVCTCLKIEPHHEDLGAVEQGRYPLLTVDINHSFDLPSRSDVHAWIRAAEYKSKTRHGRPQMKGGTLYWGKNSARWAIKVYSKGDEIEAPKHKLPYELRETLLPEWADNKLRLELRLKKKELIELGITQACDLTVECSQKIYETYVRKIQMNEQIALSSEIKLNLPQKLRSTYLLWEIGEDLRDTLPKTTFYRHRKELSDFGIDITIRRESNARTNIIPLIRILEAKPAVLPHWAFDSGLIHHSASIAI